MILRRYFDYPSDEESRIRDLEYNVYNNFDITWQHVLYNIDDSFFKNGTNQSVIKNLQKNIDINSVIISNQLTKNFRYMDDIILFLTKPIPNLIRIFDYYLNNFDKHTSTIEKLYRNIFFHHLMDRVNDRVLT